MTDISIQGHVHLDKDSGEFCLSDYSADTSEYYIELGEVAVSFSLPFDFNKEQLILDKKLEVLRKKKAIADAASLEMDKKIQELLALPDLREEVAHPMPDDDIPF